MEFIRRFQKVIALTVLRVSRLWGSASRTTVDDLVQDTYLRLCADRCKLLRMYKAAPGVTDSLGALVRTVASNVAHDHFRSISAQKRGGLAVASVPPPPDDDLLSDLWSGAEKIEREAQLREIEHALDRADGSDVSGRERLIFRLYFRQGLTAAAIAAIPTLRLTTKGVESAVFRVSRYLRIRLTSGSNSSADISKAAKGESGPIPIGEGEV